MNGGLGDHHEAFASDYEQISSLTDPSSCLNDGVQRAPRSALILTPIRSFEIACSQ